MQIRDGQQNLEQLFKEYVNECRFSVRLRPETIRGYEAVFTLFLRIMPEITTCKDLTSETLNRYFKLIETRPRKVGKEAIKTGVKKSTIKTHYTKLNVFFVWLCKKNFIELNPLTNIKPPHVTYEDFKRLENSEVNKIYTAVTLHHINTLLDKRDTMMVSILLFTGARSGEFISLQVKDVNIDKKEITIRGETSKSKKTRVLKIHPILLMHIKDYLKERSARKTEHLIVSNRGDRGLSREGLKHWAKSLNIKSGVKFHLHQFRHTFACLLAEQNVSAFKIQRMMGHQNITMTMKYMRSLQTENMEEDIGRISLD